MRPSAYVNIMAIYIAISNQALKARNENLIHAAVAVINGALNGLIGRRDKRVRSRYAGKGCAAAEAVISISSQLVARRRETSK